MLRVLPNLLLAAILLSWPHQAKAAGAAYVVRSSSAGLYERPNAADPDYTLIRGEVVTVLQSRGEWYRIITERGEEGWVRESSVSPILDGEEEESKISEASPDDATEAVFYDFIVGKNGGNIRREGRQGAPIVRTAKTGEIFTIVLERDGWYQVSRNGRVEGWMFGRTGEKRESRNLALRVTDLLDGKLAIMDQIKSEAVQFRREGWFPSFFLRDPQADVVVAEGGSGKTVTVNLAYALKDTEHRTVINTSDFFFLPGANRIFFTDLMLSLLQLSPEVTRAGLHLWFGALEADGRLSWRSEGELELGAGTARRLSAAGEASVDIWAALEKNTLSAEIWEPR